MWYPKHTYLYTWCDVMWYPIQGVRCYPTYTYLLLCRQVGEVTYTSTLHYIPNN